MKKRTVYQIEPRSLWAGLAIAFMAMSFILRLYWAAGESFEPGRLAMHVILPLSANVIFILCVLLWGKKAVWTTFIPALMGVVFFVIKALGFPSMTHTVLCICLYALVAVLYGLTVFGVLPTKKLLIPLFGLPLLYHIFVEDLIQHREVYVLSDWLQEFSVLCIMACLLCLSIGLEKAETR